MSVESLIEAARLSSAAERASIALPSSDQGTSGVACEHGSGQERSRVRPVAVSLVGALEEVMGCTTSPLASGSGSPHLQAVAEAWGSACAVSTDHVRDGLTLVAQVAGIADGCLPSMAFAASADREVSAAAVEIAKAAHASPVMAAALPSVSATSARQVTSRLGGFFAAATTALLRSGTGTHEALMSLSRWLSSLAAVSLRSLRHAATAAGSGVLVALGRELRTKTVEQATLSRQLSIAKTGGTRRAAHVGRLHANVAQSISILRSLQSCAFQMHDRLLQPRLRDTCAPIRRLAVATIARLIEVDPATYASRPWPERVIRALCDPCAEVRRQAIEAISSWYSVTKLQDNVANSRIEHSMRNGHEDNVFDGDTRVRPADGVRLSPRQQTVSRCRGVPRVKYLVDLAPHVASLMAERSCDVEPRVAAAAIRGVTSPYLAPHLSSADSKRVASLCFGAPDSHSLVREEAALFVDRHLLDGIHLVTHNAVSHGETIVCDTSDDHEVCVQSDPEISLLTLAGHLAQRLLPTRLHLAHRVVGALWGKAPCLRHWATMADLVLLGEGGGAAHGLRPLPDLQRLAILHILDASVSHAAADDSILIDDAVTALTPRLPRLLGLCSADERTIAPMATTVRLLVSHACARWRRPDGRADAQVAIPRSLVAALRNVISLPLDFRTSVHLVDALFALTQRSSEALCAVVRLASDMRTKCEDLLGSGIDGSKANDAAVSVTRLIVLCNRGVDVLCVGQGPADEPRYALLHRVLQLLELRCVSVGGGSPSQPDAHEQAPTSGGTIIALLLELAFLLIAWRAHASSVAPSADMCLGLPRDTGALAESTAASSDATLLPLASQRLREASARLAHIDTCMVVRLQAMSAHLGIVQLAMSSSCALGMEHPPKASAGSRRVGCQLVHGSATDCLSASVRALPIGHVVALESCLRNFLDSAAAIHHGDGSPDTSVSLDGQRVEATPQRDPPVTAVRRLLERSFSSVAHLSDRTNATGSDRMATRRDGGSEDVVAALAACRMVAESEHDSIYCGRPGVLVLLQLVRKSASAIVREIALKFALRLRRLACKTRADAARNFALQMAAVTEAAQQDGAEAGARLADTLLLPNEPLPPPGSSQLVRLSTGLREALRSHVVETVLSGKPLCLEAVLPLIRGAGSVLRPSDARGLAAELASAGGGGEEDCARTGASTGGRRSCLAFGPSLTLPPAAVSSLRAVALALKFKGDSSLRRGSSWRSRLAQQARKRLRRKSHVSSDKSRGPSGWLTKRADEQVQATLATSTTGKKLLVPTKAKRAEVRVPSRVQTPLVAKSFGVSRELGQDRSSKGVAGTVEPLELAQGAGKTSSGAVAVVHSQLAGHSGSVLTHRQDQNLKRQSVRSTWRGVDGASTGTDVLVISASRFAARQQIQHADGLLKQGPVGIDDVGLDSGKRRRTSGGYSACPQNVSRCGGDNNPPVTSAAFRMPVAPRMSSPTAPVPQPARRWRLVGEAAKGGGEA
eukprot:TRINITY_DN54777_c0_g1_i1.p1 TRINITY_DN54777_c0_g1~~TRINITY_DN54777_c0_g1_i1.p1  ORF type:complete len:1493 (-),score=180.26 TRINITY_DN54777_c0_g1_i1:600-5078(-)